MGNQGTVHNEPNAARTQQWKTSRPDTENLFLQTGSTFKSNSNFNHYSQMHTLKISGMAETPDESETSLKQLVVEMGESLDVTLREEDIVGCSRIQGSGNGLTPSLFVTFLEPEDQDAFLVKRHMKSSMSTSYKDVSFSPQAVIRRSTRVQKCEYEV